MLIKDYIKGMDISTLLEEEAHGAKYYDNGKQGDLIDILKAHGANSVRLRIWNDPYDDYGNRYGAGTNDLAATIRLARRAREKGMSILLDFHYSDFWADPGKQYVPKAWREYDAKKLADAVYRFTKETLVALKNEGLLPGMVQVGNELTAGMLWPLGNRFYGKDEADKENEASGENAKVPYFNPDLRSMLHAGIRAVREVSKDIIVMLHLDNGGNNALYREWFDGYFGFDSSAEGRMDTANSPAHAVDFDVIGLSYYPFWHGHLDALRYNMNDIAKRYGKELVIAEVSMGFSTEDYRRYEISGGNNPISDTTSELKDLIGMATREEVLKNLEFDMSPNGQAEFMRAVGEVIREVPNGLGRGYYYWEPGWVPVPGCGWATDASLEYIHAEGPCGNEWANQALFDYEGNALPALGNL